MLLLSDRYYGVSISGVPKPVQKVLPSRGTYGILSPDSNRRRDVCQKSLQLTGLRYVGLQDWGSEGAGVGG